MTSALVAVFIPVLFMSGMLGHLGFHIPQPEVKADDTNPRGFGEPRWVVDEGLPDRGWSKFFFPLVFSPDDRLLLYAGVDRVVRLVSLARPPVIVMEAGVQHRGRRGWPLGRFRSSCLDSASATFGEPALA